ncbi:hypothetical protein F7725_027760 [Dissostichus mawsoni]|uniref:Profilin n=1 Tax=Dissostichus mawsoni TaxID=36200 RepID=A0A7J5XDV7_DISMA|nr:hypothetical protein F7725_027760 [Dissostichus mawsoni]
MSWQSYVDNLMADGSCQDTAIVGYTDAKYVWASSVGEIATRPVGETKASDKRYRELKIKRLAPANASFYQPRLSLIPPEEIDVLTGKDREAFFCGGMTLGNKKCSVIRDSLPVDGDWTMDIRTKSSGGEPTYNISVGRAGKALVFVMGKEGVHGGQLNKKAFHMAEYLRKSGY